MTMKRCALCMCPNETGDICPDCWRDTAGESMEHTQEMATALDTISPIGAWSVLDDEAFKKWREE